MEYFYIVIGQIGIFAVYVIFGSTIDGANQEQFIAALPYIPYLS